NSQHARPERGSHEDGEDDFRKGEHDVDDAHDDRIRPATQIGCHRAEYDAQHKGDDEHREGDEKGNARSVDQAAQCVSPEIVGSKQVLAVRRVPRIEQVGLGKRMWCQKRRQYRREHDKYHDGATEYGIALPEEAAPEIGRCGQYRGRWSEGAHARAIRDRMRGSITAYKTSTVRLISA